MKNQKLNTKNKFVKVSVNTLTIRSFAEFLNFYFDRDKHSADFPPNPLVMHLNLIRIQVQ